jgi:hypothetical protein
MNRRGFLGMNLALSASILTGRNGKAALLDSSESQQHQKTAAQIRLEAAASRLNTAPAQQITSGDEER